MQVSNTDNFDVVFTFVSHPYFGVVLEANAVLLLPNGNYSLTYQRIRPQNAEYYKLNAEQTEVVKTIDGFEVAEIMNKFYTGKKIRPADFFPKYYTPELHKMVREYIEKRLISVIPVVKNYPMFWSGDTGNAIHSPISYSEEPASVLFHFRREENGTNYFATIKHQDKKVEFYKNNSELLIESPAWLLTPTHLLHFSKFTDGKKIRPFLNRRFIHVEPKQEAIYMDKFVKPLLENHDVYAVGFDIVTEQLTAKPLIKLQKLFDDKFLLNLSFRYGEWVFPYNTSKRVNVRLETHDNGFTFHRIRRSHNQEQEIMGFLKQFGIRNYSGSLFCLEEDDNPMGMIEWINLNNDELIRAGFEVSQEIAGMKVFLGKISLELKVNQESDWFDLHAVVKFGNYEIPFIRLRNNIIKNQREYILPNGEVAILPLEWFHRFGKIAHMATEDGEKLRLKNMHFSLLSDLDKYLDFSKEDQEAWKNRLTNNKIPVLEIPDYMNVELRNYQKEGYEWIMFLMKLGIGPLLADDMGLGKTIQTLAVLQALKNEGQSREESLLPISKPSTMEVSSSGHLVTARQLPLFGNPGHSADTETGLAQIQETAKPRKEKNPFLIIAPKSLLYNWQIESNKFAPGLKVLIYSGLNRTRLLNKLHAYDIIVTSYGTMRIDIEKFKKIKFHCIVLDESQAIKNPASQTAKSLQQLSSTYRLALTGTPIENSLMDIWSQMNFLNQGLLGTYNYFEKQYIRPIEKTRDAKLMRDLRNLLDPFIMRRTKKQVATELPEKIEKVHYCEMSPEQAEVYEITRNQYRNEILATVKTEGLSRSRLRIFNGLMHLRQLALNPILKNAEYDFSSGKDDEIKRMLLRAVESGHKVLLFSQFVSYLKIFSEMLSNMGIPFCYLDGSLDEKERQQQIIKFQENKDVKVFLLSLRAGNSGINLTAADYVFLADPWWNPFTMKQAEDRAHRIGQDKTVFSYKFITKNTIEEKILKLQERKIILAESIIPDEDSILSSLNVNELQELFD